MAASNPQGQMQFWNNGQPFNGVLLGSNDGGEMQFWIDGAPFAYLFPPSAPATAVKTIMGLARASVKTVNGLAIASVKTWNGLT